MMKKEAGYSLIELMVTILISALVLAATSNMFVSLLRGLKQQSKIAETNIEGVVGLEILRQDLESTGLGLPWVIPGGVVYLEAANNVPPFNFNDAPANPPRAILSGNGTGNGVGGFAGSDYLVIKSASVARNAPSEKWTTLQLGNATRDWASASENLVAADQVIVLTPGTTATDVTRRTLVVVGANFSTTFGATAGYAPVEASLTNLIYGIDPANSRAPFNRADYFISAPANLPRRCAPNTGVLVKSVMSQANGTLPNPVTLLDCVADLQVVYRLDTNADGIIDATMNNIVGPIPPALTAQQISQQVREMWVDILAHEGQRDPSYTYNPPIAPSSVTVGAFGFGRNFDLNANIGAGWQNYRWKVYTIVIKPKNLS